MAKKLGTLGKRWFVFLLLVLSSCLVFAYVNSIPNPGHGGDKIFVRVNGVDLKLQDAIDSGRFGVDYFGTGFYSGVLADGHANDVFVRVNGVDKSLQDAIIDGSLCSSGAGGSGSYSGSVALGHKGEDILVNFGGEKNLQQAINDGNFGYNVWSPSPANTCTTSIINQTNCGRSRTVNGEKVCLPDYYGLATFHIYLTGFPSDTCDGKMDSWERFTCSPTDDMTCIDSWMQPWVGGDRHGESRTVICRL